MGTSSNNDVLVRPAVGRALSILFSLGLIAAIGIKLTIQGLTTDNLLETLMVVATWIISGIFLLVGCFYYSFAAAKIKTMGWRRAYVYLCVTGTALLSIYGLGSFVIVLVEGQWSEVISPLCRLAIAAYVGSVLLPPMWREMVRQEQAAQHSKC